MNCPSCKNNSIPFWNVWLRGRFLGVKCPNCQTKIKVKKKGFGSVSSYLLGVPIGVLLVLAIEGIFRNWPIFVIVTVITLTIDIQLDRHYVELEIKGKD